jgi:hypothetical protein
VQLAPKPRAQPFKRSFLILVLCAGVRGLTKQGSGIVTGQPTTAADTGGPLTASPKARTKVSNACLLSRLHDLRYPGSTHAS